MARLQMLCVAMGSAVAGFLTTFTLLHLDVDAMWLRYGASVLAAYGVFLAMTRWGIGSYRENPGQLPQRAGYVERPSLGGGDLLGDALDLICEDLGLIVVLIMAGGGLVYLAAWLLPEWISIWVLEGVAGMALVRRTAFPFACILVLFVGVGFACSAYAPEAKSIGGVMRHAIERRVIDFRAL